MNREEFGSWGIELSKFDFSKAIFVTGLIGNYHFSLLGKSAEEISKILVDLLESKNFLVRWDIHSYIFQTGWWSTHQISASTLVEVWDRITSQHPDKIRIQIYNNNYYSYDEKNWIFEILSEPKLLLSSIYFFNDNKDKSEPNWDYPLRVGFLDDALSQEFRSDIEGLKFYDQSLKDRHIKIIW